MLMALSTPLVAVVYGERWSAAAAPLLVLGPYAAIRVLEALLSDLLIAVGGTRYLFLLQSVWFVTLLPTMLICVGIWGTIGAAVAHVAVGVLVVLPFALIVINRRTVAGTAWVFQSIGRPLVGAVAAGAVARLVSAGSMSPWLTLGLGGGLGALTYLCLTGRWLRRHLIEVRRIYGPAR